MSPPDRPTTAEAEQAEPTRRHPGVLIGRPWIRLVDALDGTPPHLAASDPMMSDPTTSDPMTSNPMPSELIVPAADRAA